MPPAPQPDSPRRVLVIAEGQLGDLLLLTPALRALTLAPRLSDITVLVVQRRTYQVSSPATDRRHIVHVPAGGTSEVMLNDPHVTAVAEIDRTRLRSLGIAPRIRAEAAIISWLRKARFDTVICTFPQDRFFQWAFLSGARLRVGGDEGGASRLLLNRRIRQRKSDGGVLKYYCALAVAAGGKPDSLTTRFEIPEQALAWATETFRELGLAEADRPIAVHPGASGPYRVWPPASFAALIDEVQTRSGRPVVLCGSEFDRGVVEEVRKRCVSRVRVRITDGGVSRLAALLKKSALCVSNNSGPRHLAVAVGTPSLAVIPRFDDIEWKIYEDELRSGTIQSDSPCSSCGSGACHNRLPPGEQYGSYCMRDVSPRSVAERVDAILRQLQ